LIRPCWGFTEGRGRESDRGLRLSMQVMLMSAQSETLVDTSRVARGSATEVSLLAFPVVVQSISETIMQLVDSAMVGRLGATELGAIGFAGIWIWTLFVPFTGTAVGVQTFVSRHDGADERALCGPWIWQAIWLLVPAMAVWMFGVALIFPVLVALIGPSPELSAAAIDYGWARLPGGPAVVANFVFMSFFRGVGDTRTPLYAVLGGILVNVVLAYGLIFGELGLPRWGVAGAGVAISAGSWTILAILASVALSRPMRARYHTQPVRPEREKMLRFLRTSAPIGGQWVLDMTTFAIFGSIIARMGDVSMAASQAMLQLLSLSFMQANAISLASGTLVGRYIGARDLGAAERSYRSSQMLALVLSALVAILFVSAPEALLGIFTRDARVLEIARPLLVLAAFFQVIDAIGIVAGGSLRGAGDTRWPFVLQATLAWALRLPVVYVAAILLEGGVFGAWIGELIFVFVLSLAFVLRFRAGHWRTVRI
jgi:multidrug resistance protein, MATE family